MLKTAIQQFCFILGAALLSSLLGGLFAMLVAVVSPEFVTELFQIDEGVSPSRYSFSVGLIWGLFIGAAVGGFSSALSVLFGSLKIWIAHRK